MIINFINGGGDPEAEAQLSARTAELTGVIDRTISGITIPSGVTTIGENAFASCSALTEVVIPSSVTNIEAGAFGENRSLESISFEGTTPPTVEEGAFSQLPTGVTVNVPEGSEDAYSAVTENIDESKAKIVYFTDINDNVTTWYSKYPELDYDTPDNVMPTSQYGAWKKVETQGIKSLDANCFINTLSTEYVLGEECDFSYCTPFRYGDVEKVIFKCPTLRSNFDGRLAETAPNLSSITFYCPEAPLLNTTGTPITTADTAAVGELIVPEGAHNYGIYKERMCGEDWTIKNLSGQTMGTVELTDTNDNVQDYAYQSIANGAFSGATYRNSIKAVRIKNIDTIGSYAFHGCKLITTIDVQARILNNQAFRECDGIRAATFQEGVENIKLSAFADCTGLQTISLPSTLTNIGSYAFLRCSNLTGITCYAQTAPTISDSFGGVASAGTLYVPIDADYSTWISALPSDWNVEEIPHNVELFVDDGQGEEIQIYMFEGDIPDGQFSGRTDITYAGLTDFGGITGIGEGAFSGCTNLIGFGAVDSELETIGANAFRGCPLEDIQLPQTTSTIGDNAFAGCSNLSFIECDAPSAPALGTDVFSGIAEEGELHLFDENVTGYEDWVAALPSGWTVVYDN